MHSSYWSTVECAPGTVALELLYRRIRSGMIHMSTVEYVHVEEIRDYGKESVGVQTLSSLRKTQDTQKSWHLSLRRFILSIDHIAWEKPLDRVGVCRCE